MENFLVGGTSLLNKITKLTHEDSFNIMSEATDISITNTSGDIVFINQNFLDTTGYSKEELIGKNHRVLNSNYHSDYFWSSMWNKINAGIIWQGSIRNKKKNGEIYWLNTRIFPLKDDKQRLIGFMSFRRDITETKIYESLLKKSESKLKALYDSNPDAYILVSLERNIIYYNKSANKVIHKLTGNRIKSNSRIEDIVKNYKHIDWRVMSKRLPDEEVIRNTQLQFRDGTKEWYSIIHRAVYSESNELIGTSITLRNIHKSKIAEEALQLSQKKYQNLYNNTPSMYFTLDVDWSIKSVNDFGAQALGYTTKELIGKPVNIIVAKEYLVIADELLNKCINTPGKIYNWELEKVDKNKNRIWVNETAWGYRNESDELQINIICEDITEKRNSEEKLRQLNVRLTALIEAIPDAIFFKDGGGRWLITNDSAKKLFQLENIDWVGKTEMELANLHPEFREVHEACLIDDEKAWAARKLIMAKETIVNEFGEAREFEVRKMPIFKEDGSRKALVIIGSDVTERNQMENQLRDEQNLFMGGPTTIFKWQNTEGWAVQYVSSNVYKLLGYTPEELQNTQFSNLIHPQDIKRVSDEIESNLSARKYSFGQTYRVKTKSGEYRWIYDYLYVKLNEEGNPTMFLSYANDVTEKLEYEKKIIIQNEKLLGIAWLFSHEVRGPVARIKGLSNIFNYSNDKDPVNKEILKRIQEPIDELDKIIGTIVTQTYELNIDEKALDYKNGYKNNNPDSDQNILNSSLNPSIE